MSTASAKTSHPPAVLHGIDWRTYSGLLRVLRTNRRFRLTYDRETLEIVSPLWEHENPAYLLGSFIDALTEELNLSRRAGRSVTLRRKRKQRGLEPDNCYWIASAARLQGKTRLDLRIDPPPDLAIEVDVTSSSMDRMSIYAALGVPEVWRLSESGLMFNVLQAGAYQAGASISFPQLAASDITRFLNQLCQLDDAMIVRQFRDWVRQNLLPGRPSSSP